MAHHWGGFSIVELVPKLLLTHVAHASGDDRIIVKSEVLVVYRICNPGSEPAEVLILDKTFSNIEKTVTLGVKKCQLVDGYHMKVNLGRTGRVSYQFMGRG